MQMITAACWQFPIGGGHEIHYQSAGFGTDDVAHAFARLKTMRTRTFHREQEIPAAPEEVFDFFADAQNLGLLTPSWMHFKMLAQSYPEIQVGTMFHYQLAWNGLPIRWTTRIEDWRPPASFVDVQLQGPYRFWRHTHIFDASEDGTLMRDKVEYAVPMGFLGDILIGWLVRRDLKRIFDYRARQISAIFKFGSERHK